MPFRLAFATDPFPWILLASVFLGAAVSRATRRTSNRRDPDRARTWKWILVCMWLSLAVVLAAGGVLVPGVERILDVRLAFVAAAGFALTFVATRFRKALGIPVLVLLVAAIAAVALFFQSLRAFTGETEIARVNVLSADGAGMRLEVVPKGRPSALVDLKGTYFAPVVKVVIFNDAWVFLGARTWYRFVGIASYDVREEMPQQAGEPWRLPQPTGISATLWSAFESFQGKIPGVRATQIDVVLKRADAAPGKPSRSFSVRVQNDGGVEVVAASR
jgi:hypothetical protein